MRFEFLNWRRCSQVYFLLFYLVAGFCLYKAVKYAAVLGEEAFSYRFPGLEGFLPISAMVGLKYWLATGNYDPIHPAGLTILLLAIFSTILLKRGFCSHICPIGTISEYAYKVRIYFLPKKLVLPKVVSYGLKTPKYLILAFLGFLVFIGMSVMSITMFIRSPYNMISEIKMMNFFMDPSLLTLKVIVVLVLLSLVISNFWCRFLCPYGALLSLFTAFSSIGIHRDESRCIACHSCERACPNQLLITDRKKVTSLDCTVCQNCVAACPKNAVSIQSGFCEKSISPRMYTGVLLGVFAVGIFLAMLTGHWQSEELAKYWSVYASMPDKIFH